MWAHYVVFLATACGSEKSRAVLDRMQLLGTARSPQALRLLALTLCDLLRARIKKLNAIRYFPWMSGFGNRVHV